jgi:hypothetical protein
MNTNETTCEIEGCNQPRYVTGKRTFKRCEAHYKAVFAGRGARGRAKAAGNQTKGASGTVQRAARAALPSAYAGMRWCSGCGRALPQTNENWDLSKDQPFGLLNWFCRQCDGSAQPPTDEEAHDADDQIADLRQQLVALQQDYDQVRQQLTARGTITPLANGEAIRVIAASMQGDKLLYVEGKIIAAEEMPTTDSERLLRLRDRRREGFFIAEYSPVRGLRPTGAPKS